MFGGGGGGGDFGGGGGNFSIFVALDDLKSAPSAELLEVSLESQLNFSFDTLNAVLVLKGVVSVALQVALYPEDEFMSWIELSCSPRGDSGCAMDPEVLAVSAVS